jgi:glycosyltransferase involved in cell wall biosynthesis
LGGQPAVGISRVELTLCEHALGDPLIGLVIFDPLSGVYRRVSTRLRAYVAFICAVTRTQLQASRYDQIRTAFSFLPEQIVYQDNETARRFADALLGSKQRRGVVFHCTKYGLRLGLWGALALRAPVVAARRLWQRIYPPEPLVVGTGRGVLLVSHEIRRHPEISAALARAGVEGAHIIYDLIPLRYLALTGPRMRHSLTAFFRRVLTAPERLIAISYATRDDLLRWNAEEVKAAYPFDIPVCPLGSQLLASDSPDAAIAALMGRRFVVYCSSIETRKNHDFLVQVWARLARELDATALPDLALIGRKTTGWDALQAALAAAPEIVPRVHVLHGVPDIQLRWAYRHAWLGLFPSSAEGWGFGVAECLAYQLPVLHSDLPVLHEVAQGLMPAAPVRDLEAWATRLRDLLMHPESIDLLRQKIAQHYRPLDGRAFAADVLSCLYKMANDVAPEATNERPPHATLPGSFHHQQV